MYESDLQTDVSDAIISGDEAEITLGVTDNERCVVVTVTKGEAYYTADEARDLAQSLKCVSDQRWDGDNDTVVEYIRDLADIVDKDMSADEFQAKWSDRDVNMKL